jgi:hypothetical protein
MALEPSPVSTESVSIFGHSPIDRLLKHTALGARLSYIALFWISVAWLPLLILSLIGSVSAVKVSFLKDFPIHFRFLVSMTILIVSEGYVEERLSGVTAIMAERGMLNHESSASVSRTLKRVHLLARSLWAEFIIIAIAAAVVAQNKIVLDLPVKISSWKTSGVTARLALFWYVNVSLTVYRYILFRWVWKFFLWSYFLFEIARARLDVQVDHPDQQAGLGFLVPRHFAFGVTLSAISIVISANIVGLLVYAGARLKEFREPSRSLYQSCRP